MQLLNRFFADADKKSAIAWAFFDFANSSYALIIASFVFPIYYREVIAGPNLGDFYWGLITSIAVVLGGLVAPVIGAIADYDARKKSKFVLFTLAAIIGTATLYFSNTNLFFLTSLIFIITHLCYEIAQTLYDSFLARVSTQKTVGRISGLAWGFGYVGGIVAMLLLKPFYSAGYQGALETTYKLSFPLTALFFLIFALPSFFALRDSQASPRKVKFGRLVKIGIQNVFNTVKNLKTHKSIAWFLLGFYLMNDALVTIFAFLPIYAKTTLGLTIRELTIPIFLVQLIGFPAAVFFGWLSDRRGSKKILLATIVVWSIIIALLSLTTSKAMFYVITIITAFVIGSSQAIARSWLSKLVPEEKRFEFFGFNGFASKVAAATGPVLFGVISSFTGSQRLAVASLLPYFILSFAVFSKIKYEDAAELSVN